MFALHSEPKTLNPLTSVDSAVARGHRAADRGPHPHRSRHPAHAARPRQVLDGFAGRASLRAGAAAAACASRTAIPSTPTTWSSASSATSTSGTPPPSATCSSSEGKPIVVRKLGPYRIAVDLEQPYAAAERLFDSIAILPRHLLEKAQGEGKLSEAWTLATPPAAMAGLGPFRVKSYAAGDRVVLERNPHYWKVDAAGQALPYVDEIVFLLAPSEDARGPPLQVRRDRPHHPPQRGQLQCPLDGGAGGGALPPAGPRGRPRVHLPVLQPERPRPGDAARASRASRPGSASAPSGRPSPPLWTGRGWCASSTRAGPPPSAPTSRRGTSSG